MSSPELVKRIARELSDEDDQYIQDIIDLNAPRVSATVWGAKYDFALALLTAHMITVFAREGAGGAIKREKVGDLEVEYAVDDKSSDGLRSTSYGRQYRALQKCLAVTPFSAGC